MTEVLVIACAVLGYGLVSGRLAGSPITTPMVFTTVGLAVGTEGLGWFDLPVEGEAASILVEATLVLVLFSDAVRIDLRVLRRESWLPARLLGVGLPLTLVAGTVSAHLVFDDLSWAEAALLGAVLAPTDAALGQAVVSDRRLPVRLRQGLNVESGLNDGIIVPVVTVCLALVAAESDGFPLASFVTKQIGFGLGAGLAAGAGGGWLLQRQAARGRVDGVYQQLGTIAIAVAAFAGAELLDGNGFIASFTAGIAFGAVARDQCSGIDYFTEDEGELFTVITFTIFGAVFLAPVLDQIDWRLALYVAASLTVVRMVPVLVALFGTGTLMETRLFAGWFGPRGLASILFALLIIEELEGSAAEQLFAVTSWTVLVSVFAHGLSAAAWSGRLARRLEHAPGDMPEMMPAPELPTRRRPM